MLKVITELFACLLLLSSCQRADNELLEKMQDIKILGNRDPELAMSKLDSLDAEISTQSKYVQMKYDLLRIRLQDKANIIPESDKPIKEVLEYFTENGSALEKQEANYYAGSVYRDLQDAPTAIGYFLQAEQWAQETGRECDSIMWGNACSNLSYLYYNVTDFHSSLEYAKKEYELALLCDDMWSTTILHLADAYFYNGSTDSAFKYYDLTLDRQIKNIDKNTETLEILLAQYAHNGKKENAEICATLMLAVLDENTHTKTRGANIALGYYYKLKGDTIKALDYFKKAIRESKDEIISIEASRYVYQYYSRHGDAQQAFEYADKFIASYDSMELSMNQEQTAKVNNLFRYYRDREEERKILDENEKTRNRFYWALALLIIVALGATVLFYFVRNRQLQRLNDISDCLDIVNREKSEVDKMLKMRDEELASSKNQLKDVTQELHRIEESKDRAHAELARVSAELQENEKRLEEKSLMNKNVINLLHQVQFELNAEEYLKDLKDSASGKRKLSPKEWNRFYKAIDSIWPDFNEQMCAEDKEITEDRKRVLYLNLAGFSNAQIQNLTGLSRTTVWRIKKEGVIKE